VEACERFADGELDERSYGDALQAVAPLLRKHLSEQRRAAVLWAARGVQAAVERIPAAAAVLAFKYFAAAEAPYQEEAYAEQAGLVRDIVGNPFQSLRFDPVWRPPPAVALARTAYAERRFRARAQGPAQKGCELSVTGCPI
jgi:hypothetical protein